MHTIPPYRQSLYSQYEQLYPGFEFVKRWPNNTPHKTNLIIKTTQGQFVKIFLDTAEAIHLARQEYALLQAFNDYAASGGFITGPACTLVDGPSLHLVMNDVTLDARQVHFDTSSVSELIMLFDQYRSSFDQFHARQRKQHWYVLTSGASIDGIDTTQVRYAVSDPQMIQNIREQYESKFHRWLDAWWDRVSWLLPYTREQIVAQREQYRSRLTSCEVEYSFGRYRGGHVFVSDIKQILLDPDAVWYKLVGDEIVALIWTSTLFPVHQFDSFQQWERQVDQWFAHYQSILHTSQGQMLLFYKLIGTIVMDFGHLITDEMTNNPARVREKGLNMDEQVGRGIEWNGKLLEKIFDSYSKKRI